MEIKLTIENESNELKFWIDSVSGSLCIESEKERIEIPINTAIELVDTLRQKQMKFMEDNRKNWWSWKK